MRLMAPAIHPRVMQTTMNPVDSAIGEQDEERVLQKRVSPEGRLTAEIVEFRETSDFGDKEGGCEEGYHWDGGEALSDFLGDLIFEEARVLHHSLVKYCVVEDEAADEV